MITVEHEGLGTMSKSKNNGVDPQGLVERYGADTARLFVMFASPPEQTLEWSDDGVQGAARFLRRLWTAVHEHVSAGPAPPLQTGALSGEQRQLRRAAHHTLAKAADDIGRRRNFNTAIAAAMELLNAIGRFSDSSPAGRAVRQEALEIVVLVLAPIIPHIGHALWQALGHSRALIDERWPAVDQTALAQDMVDHGRAGQRQAAGPYRRAGQCQRGCLHRDCVRQLARAEVRAGPRARAAQGPRAE